MLIKRIKAHFDCEDLAKKLLKSQWQRSEKSITYVCYRWLVAAFFIFSNWMSFNDEISKPNCSLLFMVIYLSNLNLLLTMALTTLGAGLVTCYYHQAPMYSLLKFYWFLSNHSVVVSLIVTSTYWALIYDNEKHELNLCNILVHLTNSLVLVIDLLIIDHPHRISHFIYPVMSILFYAICSAVFSILGGVNPEGHNYIYGFADWNQQPTQALFHVFCLVLLTAFVHLFVCVIHRIRIVIHQCLNEPRRERLLCFKLTAPESTPSFKIVPSSDIDHDV